LAPLWAGGFVGALTRGNTVIDKSAENMTIADLWAQLTRLNDWLRENMPDATQVTEGDTATATLWALDRMHTALKHYADSGFAYAKTVLGEEVEWNRE
jgi:hypothetical protein